MNTPTDGSMPALLAPLPKPRMIKLVFAELCNWPTLSEGTSVCRSRRSRTCARSIVSAVVTDTEIGTSCNVCSRLVAVTTITFSSSAASSACGASSCAYATVPSPNDATLIVDSIAVLNILWVIFMIVLSCLFHASFADVFMGMNILFSPQHPS